MWAAVHIYVYIWNSRQHVLTSDKQIFIVNEDSHKNQNYA